MAEKETDKKRANDIVKYHDYLKAIRQPFEAVVDDILEFVRQARPIKSTAKGTKLTGNIYDGTPISALNLWADGMYGYLCSPNLDWFSLTLPNTVNYSRTSSMRRFSGKRLDDLPEVAQWLNDCEDVMKSAFLRSNFYAVMPQFFRDGGSVGTAAMDIEEDLETGKIFFTPLHFREYCIAQDKYGRVDTLYRRYPSTYRNIVQRFGLDAVKLVDKDFEKKYENNPYDEVYVIHAVQPRLDFDPGRIDSKAKPVASYWMLEDFKDKLLAESGYRRFPSIGWRYRRETDEVYGRSPAWDAYSEIMLGNQEARTNLIAGQKMAEPPMVGPEDLRGRVNSGPKGWTWVEQMSDAPQPLNTGIQLPYAIDMRERTDKAIEKHFNVDFFLMLTQAAYNKVFLTATQVIQMAGEKAAVLATRTDTLNIEAFNPIIDRVWDIEMEAGRMPQPPDILQEFGGANLEVDYLGPLAQAQKVMFETQGIKASLETVAPIVNMFPESGDVIDADEMIREVFKANRAPASVIRSQEGVDSLRRQRIEQMQAQQTVDQVSQMAKSLPGMGKAVEGGSPLDIITGGVIGEKAQAQ
ncbi:MAG: portal protein [Anaerovoracaceae bacterium]